MVDAATLRILNRGPEYLRSRMLHRDTGFIHRQRTKSVADELAESKPCYRWDISGPHDISGTRDISGSRDIGGTQKISESQDIRGSCELDGAQTDHEENRERIDTYDNLDAGMANMADSQPPASRYKGLPPRRQDSLPGQQTTCYTDSGTSTPPQIPAAMKSTAGDIITPPQVSASSSAVAASLHRICSVDATTDHRHVFPEMPHRSSPLSSSFESPRHHHHQYPAPPPPHVGNNGYGGVAAGGMSMSSSISMEGSPGSGPSRNVSIGPRQSSFTRSRPKIPTIATLEQSSKDLSTMMTGGGSSGGGAGDSTSDTDKKSNASSHHNHKLSENPCNGGVNAPPTGSGASVVRRRHRKMISRSRSDLTKRLSNSSELSELGLRLSRNSADLERFFNEMGLERDILHPMLSSQYASAAGAGAGGAGQWPLYESASCIASPDNHSLCSGRSSCDPCASGTGGGAGGGVGGGGGGAAAAGGGAGNNMFGPGEDVRSLDTMSVVERNARIIKWLGGVKKAAGSASD